MSHNSDRDQHPLSELVKVLAQIAARKDYDAAIADAAASQCRTVPAPNAKHADLSRWLRDKPS